MMTPDELRSRYFAFFKQRGHTYVPSSPVIPEGDPTLLFTNAGMNQFKDVLLGDEKRDYTRAVNTQKCIRAGGKHNDLDEVGRSPRHLTFFEMLGNWSFGDYFKKEAIHWAWEFVTTELKLEPERLFISVYLDDDEAYNIWHEDIGIPHSNLTRLGEDDNYWSMGPTGPCGPCSEIYYDYQPEKGEAVWEEGFDDNRFIEIWNLVFMAYDRQEDGTLKELPIQSIDTGMGLERVMTIMTGASNVFQTEIFSNIFARIERERTGKPFDIKDVPSLYTREDFEAYAVIADHIRSLSFSICDGGSFSNEGRGYVLRRILRRAVRHGRNLGFDAPFLHKILPAVVESFSDVYPELRLKGQDAATLIEREEARFFRTIDRGLELFEDVAKDAEQRDDRTIPGETIFQLYDTFGFPLDLTTIMAEERDLKLDIEGYEAQMEAQRERSRAADDRYVNAGEWTTLNEGVADKFSGYTTDNVTTRVLRYRALPDQEDHYEICLEETPFYAEAGGQVGDRGTLAFEGGGLRFGVLDTQKTPAGITHTVKRTAGSIEDGIDTPVVAYVDPQHRALTAANHTATHLLHAALHKHVSKDAFQSGSLVAPDRLRFDFNYDKPVTDVQLRAIEDEVNSVIRRAIPLTIHQDVALEDAESMGAMMIFGEKYGEKVRVIQIDDASTELCGGIHVQNTADIAWFRITSESGVAAGVRRIEAVTNQGAFALAEQERALLDEISATLRVPNAQIVDRIQSLQEDRRALEQSLNAALKKQAKSAADDLAANAQDIAGVKVIATQIDAQSRDDLLSLADFLRDKLQGPGAVLVVAELNDKPALLAMVTDEANQSHGLHAGKLVNAAASAVGGKGGGRPTLAQAGGKDVSALPQAIEAFRQAITEALGA